MTGPEDQATARFEFGENWTNFLSLVDENRIAQPCAGLAEMVGNISGKSFLDAGSGSGIHSLAAVRLGAARVFSFDYDPKSVACTAEMKRRFASMANWRIEAGSALDEQYLRSLGQFDVVYSWGVLHHTGAMWKGLELITIPAKACLVICLYADQGAVSRLWRFLKRSYVAHPWSRRAVTAAALVTLWLPKLLLPHRVMSDWKNLKVKRGMSAWYDIVDWAGGYPFEFAKPADVIAFYQKRGCLENCASLWPDYPDE
jgi:2-polyprenyl-6-hydroxyphenyl methylase/3-demethylubiquinone-9 3-methyltransferase